MKVKSGLCALLLSTVTAVAVVQQVSVNYNHSGDFSQYHTYAWQIDDPNKIADSILAQASISDVDNALRARGLARSTSAQIRT
jgi:hypothetical protein